MEIKVHFLGPARDWANTASMQLSLPETASLATLREAIAKRFPGIIPALPTARFAVNHTFVRDDYVLSACDEVAVIPPVSGG